jgi:hypothetical protein
MEDAPNRLISVFTNLFRQGPLTIWTEHSILSLSVQEISSSIYEPILRLNLLTKKLRKIIYEYYIDRTQLFSHPVVNSYT